MATMKPKYPPRPAGKLAPQGESWKNYYTSLAAQYDITKGMHTDDMPDGFLADVFNYALKAEIDWEQLDRLKAQGKPTEAPKASRLAKGPAEDKEAGQATLDHMRAEFITPRFTPTRTITPEEARALDPRSTENQAKNPSREPAPAKPKTKRTSRAELERLAGAPPAKRSRRKEPAPLTEQLAILDAKSDS